MALDLPRIDPEKLLTDIISNFGGPEEYARTLVHEYKRAKEGGMARQRILDMINRLIMQIHGKGLSGDDISDMSDEALETFAVELQKRREAAKNATKEEAQPNAAA